MTKEIVLILAGIVIVVISFIISEKKLESKAGEKEKLDVEEIKVQIKKQIEQILKEETEIFEKTGNEFLNMKQEDILEKVEDEMSKISNEKIMSFSEYGEQILGKIEQNHQEVVFLYDMLNQKENEMKKLVREIDYSKVNLEEMLVAVKEEEKVWEEWKQEKEEVLQELARKELALQKVLMEEKSVLEKNEKKMFEQEVKKQKEEVPVLTAADILAAKREGRTIDYFSSVTKEEEPYFSELSKIHHKDIKEKKVENADTVAERGPAANIEGPFSFGEISMGSQEKDVLEADVQNEEKDLNKSVLELYAQGMSVMEIAKILGRGQGEVKLIIDLYQGMKM